MYDSRLLLLLLLLLLVFSRHYRFAFWDGAMLPLGLGISLILVSQAASHIPSHMQVLDKKPCQGLRVAGLLLIGAAGVVSGALLFHHSTPRPPAPHTHINLSSRLLLPAVLSCLLYLARENRTASPWPATSTAWVF